ncbi:MAG: hypothetical protein KF789_12250 [Bdellovibrionaceae bacterium]|nr:hypothetical protein [Pseudobdellovibrionaceae bacterium]
MLRVAVVLILGLVGFGVGAKAQTSQLKTQVPSEGRKNSDWNGRWKFSLAGQDYDDQKTTSTLVNFRFEAMIRYYLSEDLLFKVTPMARLQSGTTQSSRGELSPENRIYFNEASATWRALSFAFLKAGALDQGESHTPLLVGSRPFPGARASLLFGDRTIRYGLVAETAIPTAVSLTTNQNEKEPTPTLSSAGLRFDWTDGDLWKFSAKAGAFEYKNLSTSIASSSFLLGNEVDAVSDTEFRFNKPYKGFEAMMKFEFPLFGSLDGSLHGEVVQNTSAPAKENLAWRAGGGLSMQWNSRLSLLLQGESFRIEPDAAVASFVDTGFSGTNRNGYRVESGIIFGKTRSKVLAGFSESNLIYVNDRQSRDRFVQIKLETGYADF